MKKISLRRKINLYLQYRKSLIQNKDFLEAKGMRIDRVKRIYTVINVPEELFLEVYNSKSTDVTRISRAYVVEAVRDISRTLDGIGLKELYETYDTKKVDKYSFLVIIGYSLFNTRKVANNLYYIVLPSVILLISLLILNFYL